AQPHLLIETDRALDTAGIGDGRPHQRSVTDAELVDRHAAEIADIDHGARAAIGDLRHWSLSADADFFRSDGEPDDRPRVGTGLPTGAQIPGRCALHA